MLFSDDSQPGASWLEGGGRRGHAPSKLFEIVGFSGVLMFRWIILGRLLLAKIKILSFVGKSLKLVYSLHLLYAPLKISPLSLPPPFRDTVGNGIAI